MLQGQSLGSTGSPHLLTEHSDGGVDLAEPLAALLQRANHVCVAFLAGLVVLPLLPKARPEHVLLLDGRGDLLL